MRFEIGIKNGCGQCTACCTTLGIRGQGAGLDHEPGSPCPQTIEACRPISGGGCKIYGQDSRPLFCKNFECAWTDGGLGKDPSYRPDRLGLMVTMSPWEDFIDGVWVEVDGLVCVVTEVIKGGITGNKDFIFILKQACLNKEVDAVCIVHHDGTKDTHALSNRFADAMGNSQQGVYNEKPI